MYSFIYIGICISELEVEIYFVKKKSKSWLKIVSINFVFKLSAFDEIDWCFLYIGSVHFIFSYQ